MSLSKKDEVRTHKDVVAMPVCGDAQVNDVPHHKDVVVQHDVTPHKDVTRTVFGDAAFCHTAPFSAPPSSSSFPVGVVEDGEGGGTEGEGKGEEGVRGKGEEGGENSVVRRMVIPESELDESCLSLSCLYRNTPFIHSFVQKENS
jgi:hypothetical protein